MYELGQLCVLHGEISDDEPVQSASFPVEHLLVLPLKPPSQVTVHGVQFVHGLHSINIKNNVLRNHLLYDAITLAHVTHLSEYKTCLKI